MVEYTEESFQRTSTGSAADRLQFYPTPASLAERAWGMFETPLTAGLILDACAGTGALSDVWFEKFCHRIGDRRGRIEAVELDVSHHATLRAKGMPVVGMDFLSFEGGAIYAKVVTNPPFAQGAKHTLRAFSILWSGEVVSIINAETIRNPYTEERRRLCALIEKCGKVEYVADAFKGEDVVREANVDVAIVHLRKDPEDNSDWIGPTIAGLQVDRATADEFKLPTELALPGRFVENQVLMFRQAVKAMRASIMAEAVASHFAQRIGQTLGQASGKADARGEEELSSASVDGVRKAFQEGYARLKDRAWASVLRSTEALSKLSRKVQKEAEAKFQEIATLEFCETTVYGFLLGLVESQPQMNQQMCEDLFDAITRLHEPNAVFYRVYRSNTRHRTNGIRLRMTRFILQGHSTDNYARSVSWETNQTLADIDKVSALMAGVQRPAVGLVDLFASRFEELKQRKRLAATYFEVRYFAKTGTLHVFARDQSVIDRLNKTVGIRRGWLPPVSEAGSDAFWAQYDKAEKLDSEVRAEVSKLRRASGSWTSRWDDPFAAAMHETRDGHEKSQATVASAIENVLDRHGLLEALTKEEQAAQLTAEGEKPVQAAADGGQQLLLLEA